MGGEKGIKEKWRGVGILAATTADQIKDGTQPSRSALTPQSPICIKSSTILPLIFTHTHQNRPGVITAG